MPRGAAVRRADIDRAIKALHANGLELGGVEVMPGGGVRVLPKDLTLAAQGAVVDEFEAWSTKRALRED